MYEKTIICLANSRKPPSGRCVAGKEVTGEQIGQWVRPVSARSTHEVSEEERRYNNGKKAQLLDIIEISLSHHAPMEFQVENHVLDDGHYWVKTGTATWEQVCSMVDGYDSDFWCSCQETRHGINDKLPSISAAAMQSSLKLVRVSTLQLEVQLEDGFEGRPGRRRVRGRFQLEGRQYLLSVTDPEIEEHYLAMPNGTYSIGDAVLCVSIGEIWNGFAFRLVASVITEGRCKERK